jgi:hypothetical protein
MQGPDNACMLVLLILLRNYSLYSFFYCHGWFYYYVLLFILFKIFIQICNIISCICILFSNKLLSVFFFLLSQLAGWSASGTAGRPGPHLMWTPRHAAAARACVPARCHGLSLFRMAHVAFTTSADASTMRGARGPWAWDEWVHVQSSAGAACWYVIGRLCSHCNHQYRARPHACVLQV